MNDEIKNVFSLFFDDTPITIHLIDTSRGDADFRATFIIETAVGSKYVLKLADNDFTFPEKICVWQRTVEEYRKLGYFCPRIFRDKSGYFPIVDYIGDTDARHTQRSLHRSARSKTDFRTTSVRTRHCMTGISGTSGG